MLYKGLLGLEFYNPESKKWGQAHMRARFALLTVMLRAGENFIRIDKTQNNGKDYLLFSMDK